MSALWKKYEAVEARVAELETALIWIHDEAESLTDAREIARGTVPVPHGSQALAGASDEYETETPTLSAYRSSPVSQEEIHNMTQAERQQYEAERAVVEAAERENLAYRELCMTEVTVSGYETARGKHHAAMAAYRIACDRLAKVREGE